MSNDPNGMSESPFEEPAGPPNEEPAGDPVDPGPDPEPGKQFNWYGLRNSDPPISPSQIGRDLDLGADWWEHLFTGFLKQSGAEAAEAWQHYVISVILLVDQEHGILDDTEREDLEEDTAFDDLDES